MGFLRQLKLLILNVLIFLITIKRIEKSCNLFKFNFNITETHLNTLLERLQRKIMLLVEG